jgi:hypothetical protein
MKYTFTCEDIGTEWKNTVEFQAIQVDDIMQNFKYFLKGCSFDSDLVESRFMDEDDMDNIELKLQEFLPEEKSKSDAVMKFTVDSLSSWPKNFSVKSADECPRCKLPISVMYRHGCPDPLCKHNAN